MNIIKKNKKLYKEIFKLIKQYNNIVVYRHQAPDFDAAGSQCGLVTWLRDSFPMKKIYSLGEDFIDFTPALYPHNDNVDVDSLGDFLSIVLDTGNVKRIDNDSYSKGKKIIKIDHHPLVESYGDINLVNDELASCSELICDFIAFTGKNYPLSALAAKYLYSGIVGDSGRFLFSSTSTHTFEAAMFCIDAGIEINQDVYLKMYEKGIQDLEIQKYLLSNYKVTEKGVAYYVLTDDALKALNMRVEHGKVHMSLFSNIKGIEIWVAFTEDKEHDEIRVSIRSKRLVINEVAAKYGGGGHAQASGARLSSLDMVEDVIKDLDALI